MMKTLECFSSLEKAIDELASLEQEAETMYSGLCTNFLKHLHHLSILKHRVKDEKMLSEIDQQIVAIASTAGAFERGLSLFETRIMAQKARIDAATHDLSTIHNGLCEAVAEAELKAKALTSRLREHATNDAGVRAAVWALTNGRCFYCEVALVDPSSDLSVGAIFHIDHIVPKANGGPDHLSNYVPACDRCNTAKNDRSFVEFTRKRQTLTVIEGGAKVASEQ